MIYNSARNRITPGHARAISQILQVMQNGSALLRKSWLLTIKAEYKQGNCGQKNSKIGHDGKSLAAKSCIYPWHPMTNDCRILFMFGHHSLENCTIAAQHRYIRLCTEFAMLLIPHVTRNMEYPSENHGEQPHLRFESWAFLNDLLLEPMKVTGSSTKRSTLRLSMTQASLRRLEVFFEWTCPVQTNHWWCELPVATEVLMGHCQKAGKWWCWSIDLSIGSATEPGPCSNPNLGLKTLVSDFWNMEQNKGSECLLHFIVNSSTTSQSGYCVGSQLVVSCSYPELTDCTTWQWTNAVCNTSKYSSKHALLIKKNYDHKITTSTWFFQWSFHIVQN